LRKLELSAGVFYDKSATEEGAGRNSVDADDAAGLNDFIEKQRDKGREGVDLETLPESLRPAQLTPWTAEERKKLAVIQTAAEALRKPRRRPPRYLSQVMDWYAVNRDGKKPWDKESRNWSKLYRRFLHVVEVIGDRETEGLHVDKAINEGLREHVFREQERGIKGQSIKRNFQETVAAFRRVSLVYGLDWHIVSPVVSVTPPEEREVLMPQEWEAVLAGCHDNPGHISATIVAGLHGLIPSEVGRLDAEDMMLHESVPYLRLFEGKTGQRRRIIPIVVGLDLLREHLLSAQQWVRELTDEGPSASIKKRMRKWTGNPKLSIYCCRHTWNDRASAAQIDLLTQAHIGGWSAANKGMSFSPHMLKYGASGLEGDDRLLVLAQAQRKVMRRLIDAESVLLGKASNVVPLRG
jgi:integrase